jgi:hypothetical protein
MIANHTNISNELSLNLERAEVLVQTASEHCLRWCGVNPTLSVGVTPRI